MSQGWGAVAHRKPDRCEPWGRGTEPDALATRVCSSHHGLEVSGPESPTSWGSRKGRFPRWQCQDPGWRGNLITDLRSDLYVDCVARGHVGTGQMPGLGQQFRRKE